MEKELKEQIIVLFIGVICIFILTLIGQSFVNKEIDKCVNAGHDRVFCERNV